MLLSHWSGTARSNIVNCLFVVLDIVEGVQLGAERPGFGRFGGDLQRDQLGTCSDGSDSVTDLILHRSQLLLYPQVALVHSFELSTSEFLDSEFVGSLVESLVVAGSVVIDSVEGVQELVGETLRFLGYWVDLLEKGLIQTRRTESALLVDSRGVVRSCERSLLELHL